eukprot:CAMPEP_0118979740 /NCGR_PEP_ID=MMETSP1173-20130426/26658_1 /TAXON_ID=1034831 /ORGANISM="Rhizochromulina marina cf, Strain CCMP1243" /LENGTH=72 /DNA_ID=CAMNT_0006930019 /DNA_START=177 /DNA_END=395 /DNA_ORIENTATION=-
MDLGVERDTEERPQPSEGDVKGHGPPFGDFTEVSRRENHACDCQGPSNTEKGPAEGGPVEEDEAEGCQSARD